MTRSVDTRNFSERTDHLKVAFDEGPEAFQVASQRVLGFITEYPSLVLEHRNPTNDELAVAYQAAFNGLFEAIGDVSVGYEFATAVDKQLATEESARGSLRHISPVPRGIIPLVREALHGSFIDEIEESSDPNVVETFPRLESVDAGKFAEVIKGITSEARELAAIFEATNTGSNKIWMSDPGDIRFRGDNERVILEEKGRVMTVGKQAARYFVEVETTSGRGTQQATKVLRIEQSDFEGEYPWHKPTGSIKGHLKLEKEGQAPKWTDLLASQAVEGANKILGYVDEEIKKRKTTYADKAARVQKDIDKMFDQ